MHNLEVAAMALRHEREVDLKRFERESRIQYELDQMAAWPNRWAGWDALGRAWRAPRAMPRLRWRWPEVPRRAGGTCVGIMTLAKCPEG